MDVDDFVGGPESPSLRGARIARNAEAMRGEALSTDPDADRLLSHDKRAQSQEAQRRYSRYSRLRPVPVAVPRSGGLKQRATWSSRKRTRS